MPQLVVLGRDLHLASSVSVFPMVWAARTVASVTTMISSVKTDGWGGRSNRLLVALTPLSTIQVRSGAGMKPGDAHLYDVGAVHSPKREAPVKLIRIEGKNLDHVKRSNIKAK